MGIREALTDRWVLFLYFDGPQPKYFEKALENAGREL